MPAGMGGDDEDDETTPLLVNTVAINRNSGSLSTEVNLSLGNEVNSSQENSRSSDSFVTSTEHESSDSSSVPSTKAPSFSLRNLSSRQKFVLASTCWCDLSSYMCLSVMAPFFPEEAHAKNVNNTISGWIFGTYALGQVFFSPLFGRLLPRIGPRFLYLSGSFLAGGCTILFGLLVYVPVENGPFVFIFLCFLLRVFLAIGCSAQQTAAFTICAIEFPDTITTVFGIGEVFVGIGTMAGPAIGGAFYGIGGFQLPFYVLGGLMIAFLPLNMWMLPKDDEFRPSTNSVSFLSMLKLPMTFITSMDIVVVAAVWAILDPTLEPRLKGLFDLTPEVIGAIFLLMAAFYALSSPIWGWLADKMPDNRYLLIPGFVVTAVGSMILGPSPFLGLPNELWLNIIALIILGVSTSMALIPTFDIYIDLAEKLGIEDDMTIYSIVAGLWGSMYALGDFIGPALGGFLIDSVGFNWMMTYTAAACTIMAGLLSAVWFYETKCSKVKKFNDFSNSDSSVQGEKIGERTALLNPNKKTNGKNANIPKPLIRRKSTLTMVPNISNSPKTTSLQTEPYVPPITTINADIMGSSTCSF